MKKLIKKLFINFLNWIEYEGVKGPPGPPGPMGMMGEPGKANDTSKGMIGYPTYQAHIFGSLKLDSVDSKERKIVIESDLPSHFIYLDEDLIYDIAIRRTDFPKHVVSSQLFLFIKVHKGSINFGNAILFNSEAEKPIFKPDSTVVIQLVTMNENTWYAKTIHGY